MEAGRGCSVLPQTGQGEPDSSRLASRAACPVFQRSCMSRRMWRAFSRVSWLSRREASAVRWIASAARASAKTRSTSSRIVRCFRSRWSWYSSCSILAASALASRWRSRRGDSKASRSSSRRWPRSISASRSRRSCMAERISFRLSSSCFSWGSSSLRRAMVRRRSSRLEALPSACASAASASDRASSRWSRARIKASASAWSPAKFSSASRSRRAKGCTRSARRACSSAVRLPSIS